MLVELIKTQISKLIAYLWKLRKGEVQRTSYQVFSVDRLGYESLKHEQETIVREFLGGKNVFAPYLRATANRCVRLFSTRF